MLQLGNRMRNQFVTFNVLFFDVRFLKVYSIKFSSVYSNLLTKHFHRNEADCFVLFISSSILKHFRSNGEYSWTLSFGKLCIVLGGVFVDGIFGAQLIPYVHTDYFIGKPIGFP